MKLGEAEKVMDGLNKIFKDVLIPDRVFILRYYEHALFQAADDLAAEEEREKNWKGWTARKKGSKKRKW